MKNNHRRRLVKKNTEKEESVNNNHEEFESKNVMIIANEEIYDSQCKDKDYVACDGVDDKKNNREKIKSHKLEDIDIPDDFLTK